MDHKQFADVLTPLKVRHPNHFTSEVAIQVYNIIGHLTFDQGREIVGKLMLRDRFAPLEKDFKDAVHELFRPRTFVKPIEQRFDPIFSDEERTEIWQFVKDVASGKHKENDIKAYTEILNETIAKYYSR